MAPFDALGALLVLVAVGAALAAGTWALLRVLVGLLVRVGGMPDRAVLPAHYSSLLQSEASNYPGYCTECGTRNEPGYEVCHNCSARISTTEERREWDAEQVFEF